MRKYVFTGRVKEIESNIVVNEIRSLITIPSIGLKRGDVGGWIESEENLSHDGNCWIREDSFAFDGTVVREDAYISCDSKIKNSRILGSSKIVSSFVKDSQIGGQVLVEYSQCEKVTILHNGKGAITRSSLSKIEFQMLQMERLSISDSSFYSKNLFVMELEDLMMEKTTLYLNSGEFKGKMMLKAVTCIPNSRFRFTSYGENHLEHVEFNAEYTLFHVSNSEIQGKSPTERIVIGEGEMNIMESSLCHNTRLVGDVDIYQSKLSDFTSIYAHEKSRISIEGSHLFEMVSVESTSLDEITLQKLELGGDTQLTFKKENEK